MHPKPTYEELEQKVKELENEVTQLKLKEEQLSALINHSLIPTAIGGSNGSIISFNEALEELIGYRKSEISDVIDWSNKLYPDKEYRDFVSNNIQMALRGEKQDCTEFTITRKDGSIRTADFYTSFFKDGLIIQMVDITESKLMEDELKQSKDKFSKAFYSNAALMAISTLEKGRFLEVNDMFLKTLEFTRDEVIGKSSIELGLFTDIEERNAAIKKIIKKQGYVKSFEITTKTKSGVVLTGMFSADIISFGNKSHLLSVMHDITEHIKDEEEKKKLESQLRQAQKMESIGTLAGGIAHDFNNILSGIFGFAELAKDDTSEGSQTREYLDEVLKSAYRAKDLTKHILTFSRQNEQERKPIQIHVIIKEALKFLRASIPTTIEIHQNIDPRCGSVIADPTQIHQIIMNLCTNAYHAMRDLGGVLSVNLETVEIDSDFAANNTNLNEGRYVKLTVSDTGHGMDSVTLGRIFEPYFTTKEIGEGTGLGLAVVHGIVLGHGGAITVYGEPGKGTTFQVYFPRIITTAIPKSVKTELILRGREHILFVDDEVSLAEIGRKMLGRLGYKVTVFTSSIDALEAFREGPEEFDLVITDQTMPQMTGVKLARELMQIRQDIPVILTTGFSEIVTPEQAKKIGIRKFINKPIIFSDLGKTIRNVLDEKDKD